MRMVPCLGEFQEADWHAPRACRVLFDRRTCICRLAEHRAPKVASLLKNVRFPPVADTAGI